MEKVTITDVAAEGKAIAKVNDLVIFVPYVVPGDVVDLQIKRKKNKYAEAEAVKFHELSPSTRCSFLPTLWRMRWLQVAGAPLFGADQI